MRPWPTGKTHGEPTMYYAEGADDEIRMTEEQRFRLDLKGWKIRVIRASSRRFWLSCEW